MLEFSVWGNQQQKGIALGPFFPTHDSPKPGLSALSSSDWDYVPNLPIYSSEEVLCFSPFFQPIPFAIRPVTYLFNPSKILFYFIFNHQCIISPPKLPSSVKSSRCLPSQRSSSSKPAILMVFTMCIMFSYSYLVFIYPPVLNSEFLEGTGCLTLAR